MNQNQSLYVYIYDLFCFMLYCLKEQEVFQFELYRFIHDYPSPFGAMTMTSDGTSLTGLWFNGQRYFPRDLSSCLYADLAVFQESEHWLNLYFDQKRPDFMPRIRLQGTSFRLEVWQILKEIPYGTTITYKAIAERIARMRGIRTMAAQAVGGAVGHNPISVIIPCHRVIGTSGQLTGYAGGIELKKKLLLLEGIQ